MTIVFSLCLMVSSSLTAQVEFAFLIGEQQEKYDQLIASHSTHLLEVCDNSMNEAYGLWVSMLKDIEQFSSDKGYDIRGTKMWMNVFWAADGSLENIVFYPKPNSKNVDFDELQVLLSNFTENYQFAKKSDMPFSHYGSATFPVMSAVPGAVTKQ